MKTIVLLVVTFAFLAGSFAQGTLRHVPPAEPRVKPHIARKYPEDPTGRRITDVLFARINAASATELNAMTDVELIFTEQVTQAQIDRFIAMGGEITYQYQSVSYGWNGRIPLGQIRSLPSAMGASLVLIKEPAHMKAHLYNATQTGRVRAVWASGFAGNSSGFDGNTNITIAIVDSGVDSTHSDLSGRQLYWKDQSGTGYANGTDYDGHGTHVAGIAVGSGAAGGSASGPVYFTQFGDMSSSGNGTFTGYMLSLPASTTWRAGAKWTNGTTTALDIIDRFYLISSYSYNVMQTAVGGSPLSVSASISPSSDTTYTSGLIKSNSISGYVVTNMLSSYPASPDSFNRFRGVAPGCYWAGEKVFDDSGNSYTTWTDSALDDLVTYRTNYNIKVINMSLGVGGSPGLDTTLRQKVNTTVQNGIIVVISAGNDGGNSQVDDPGRAAYALTVGAMNGSNCLTAYTSEGFTSPSTTSGQEEDYKPDILAPGGSDYTGNILSADSNNGDSTAFADQKTNDYAAYKGTSMASPFAAGSAALVIDAMQQNGYTWDFNSSGTALFVKMLLCATATETDNARENGSYNPTLERSGTNGSGYPAGKDKYEGYGALNPDAAIEAVAMSVTNSVTETNSLGGSFSSARAWARKVSISAYVPMTVSLTVPSGADFDLYLYSTNYGSYGAPIILASSTNVTTGTSESFSYTSTTNLTAILVVKRVSGSGTFTLTATNASDNNFANAYSLSNSSSGSSPGNNTGYTTESGEPSGGGSGKTAWYSWTAPYTGKASFMTTLGVVKMYTGSAVSALTAVTSRFSNTASNNFLVIANTTYHISVDSTGGAYTLAWSYQGVTYLYYTNSATITLPTSGAASVYPISYTCSGVPGKIVSVTTTIGGVTAANFTYPKFLLDGPTQNVSLKGFMGNSVPVTNLTLTFVDYGTNMDFTTAYSGSFLPTDPLNNSVSYPSPAPSKPYSTNLDDFIGDDANGTWSLYADVDGTMSSAGSFTNWILNVTLASAPNISINTTTVNYSETVGATNLTSTATITDSDNWDFSGGSLTVQVTNNAATEDVLFVNNQGTSSGQIGVSGTTVSYSGTNFGYYTGGANGSTPLMVHFTNSVASFAAVQALFTRIAYTNNSVSSTNTRTVLFTLNDGLYGTNSVSKLVTVTAANHAPTVANPISAQTATYGSSFSFTFASNVFTDSDSGQTLTYTASSSVLTNTGIGFNGSTRTFSATTVDATNGGTIAGAYSVSVIATDNGSPAKSATNTFTLTINKTTASVTASNVARVYGATNAYTGSTSGFLSADVISATYGSTATTNSAVGTYTITPTFTDAASRLGNYTVTTNTGTLTISKAPVTVSANALSRGYGSTNPVFTVTYTGLTNGQTFASSGITGSPSLTTSATTNSSPGSYTITNLVGTLASGNYSLTMSNGTLTVTQAVLTVTASNAFRPYGATNPVFTVSYSGFTNGETLASSGVTGSPTLTTSATTNSSPGSYTITNTVGTLSSANYSFNLANGTLTVTQAVLTVTASNVVRSYGATNPVFTVSYSGFTNGQTLASSGVTGSPSLATSATTNSSPGSYTITNLIGTLSAPNYSFAMANGSLTVTQAVVTVTAGNASRVYGATNPVFTVSYSGFTNGQTLASSGITGSPTLTCGAVTNSPVGSYTITNAVGSLASANYSFAMVGGKLTVSQAPMSVTANSFARTYGATNPVFDGVIMGVTAGDNITASYSCTATTNSMPGFYSVIPSLNDPGNRLGNYTVTTNNGTLTVNMATLLVSADAKSRAYGAVNPAFTASYSGFVNGETASSGTISGMPLLTTVATTNSAVGSYAISNAVGTLASTYYAFTFTNGALTVTQAALTVTPTSASRYYGATNPVFTGTISGIANNDNITANYSTTATDSSPVGTYPIAATLNDPNLVLGNYSVTTNQGTLTVTTAGGLTNYTATLTTTNSIVALAEAGTNYYTFTDTNSGLSIVVAVTLAPYSSSNANPTFTYFDNWSGSPLHMAIDSAVAGGDGNWVDPYEGLNFSASLVSASGGIVTQSIQFGISQIGLRADGPYLVWNSSAVSKSFNAGGETYFTFDDTTAPLDNGYSAQLRGIPGYGVYQVSDLVTPSGYGLVLTASFYSGTGTSPVVTTNPASAGICVGDSVSFTAAATGSPAPTVQWQVETNGGGSFVNISDATNSTYTFTPDVSDSGSQYRAMFSNAIGKTNSAAAMLTVNAYPDATISVPFTTLTNNQSYTASAPAGAATYAWTILNGTITSATNGQSIDFTPTSLAGVTLNVTVANAGGCASSGSTNLAVTAIIAGTPAISSVMTYGNNQFQLSFTGTTGATYWVQASTNLTAWTTIATNTAPATFTDTNVGTYPERYYRIVAP